MIGPIVLVVAGGIAGWFSGGGAGLAAGVAVALLSTFGVAAAAAWWAVQVGRTLDPETVRQVAPRPPGFGPLCDWVYRRALPGGSGPAVSAEEGAEDP
ncbi:MAG: hypothetical protein JW785_07060 [Acidimicrobiia bacterium]|nr:hypothetical protein [Acidimicrobiia bacterium]